MLKQIQLYLALLLGLLIAFAQGVLAQECSAVLGGLRDITTGASSSTQTHHFRRFFCDQSFSSFQQAQQAGASLGIVIDGLPISFGGHSRSSEWSVYQRSVCEAIEHDDFSTESWSQTIITANANVAQAWLSCIQSGGLHFWAELSHDNSSNVALLLRFNPVGTPYETTATQALSIQPPGALNCSGDTINPGTIIGSQGLLLNCSRTTKAAVAVGVSTKNGTRLVRIPPSPPEGCERVVVKARQFASAENAAGFEKSDPRNLYPLVGTSAANGQGPSRLEYSVSLPTSCELTLRVYYAVPDSSRPVTLVWNSAVVAKDVLAQPTGGFLPSDVSARDVTVVSGRKGNNMLAVYTEGAVALPHLLQFELIPTQ